MEDKNDRDELAEDREDQHEGERLWRDESTRDREAILTRAMKRRDGKTNRAALRVMLADAPDGRGAVSMPAPVEADEDEGDETD